MTKEEAKHFSEILKAYSEDKELEYLTMDGEWVPKRTPNFDAPPFNYRIKPELKYRPYNSAEEFLQAQKEHGPYLQRMRNAVFRIPIMIGDKNIEFNNGDVDIYEDLLELGNWQDDTPCGILEE